MSTESPQELNNNITLLHGFDIINHTEIFGPKQTRLFMLILILC